MADDGEWRFDVDEVGDDAEETEPEPLEPQSISAENVLFFALGVLFALGVVASLVF
jgi:hypothetical protein